MIESVAGADDKRDVGNFELFLTDDGRVKHWWRSNHDLKTKVSAVLVGGDETRAQLLTL